MQRHGFLLVLSGAVFALASGQDDWCRRRRRIGMQQRRGWVWVTGTHTHTRHVRVRLGATTAGVEADTQNSNEQQSWTRIGTVGAAASQQWSGVLAAVGQPNAKGAATVPRLPLPAEDLNLRHLDSVWRRPFPQLQQQQGKEVGRMWNRAHKRARTALDDSAMRVWGVCIVSVRDGLET